MGDKRSFWARTWPKLLRTGAISRGDRVLAAVSGGPDSVCLAHFLASRSKPLGLKLGLAHVHHGLRGREADLDEAFVRRLGESLGVPVLVRGVDARGLARRERRSLEDAARKLRYASLRSMARKGGYEKVAVAHHADDQAETVLLNLLRGAGRRDLAGMPARRPLGPGGPELVRPLLGLNRREILAYLKLRGLRYRKDKSNEDLDRTRNWIRRKLLPILEAKNPRIRERLGEIAKGPVGLGGLRGARLRRSY